MKKPRYIQPAAIITIFFLFMSDMMAQRTLKGNISSSDEGAHLAGANVIVLGSEKGVISDKQGNFTLTVKDTTTAVFVRLEGYVDQKVELGSQKFLAIKLQKALWYDERLNIGYGSEIQKKLSTSIPKITAGHIESHPVLSLEQAIQGKVPGLFIESSNGKIGALTRMRLRGTTSIGANSQPLIVLDGIPITMNPQNVSGGGLTPLIDINVNDIASIEVLKDAAAAIYGAQASNGVLLITTRKGSVGKAKVTVDLQSGTSRPTQLREFLTGNEYIQFLSETAIRAASYDYDRGLQGFNSLAEAEQWYSTFVENRFNRHAGHADWRASPNQTDWQAMAFRDKETANSNQAQISLSGGTGSTRYYSSLSYLNQEGILLGNATERITGRLNLNQDINKHLTAGIYMGLARTKVAQLPDDNAYSSPLQMVALAPISPIKDTEGEFYDRPVTTYYNGLIENAYAKRNLVSLRNFTNAYATLNLTPALQLHGEVGGDIYTLKDYHYSGSQTFDGQSSNGQAKASWNQVVYVTAKAYFNYQMDWAKNSSIHLSLGTEYQHSHKDFTSTTGNQFPIDEIKTLSNAGEVSVGTSSIDEFRFLSYFGRMHLGLQDKYLLMASGRIDGSSRFGEHNRFGFFPAISAAWILSNEDFLKRNPYISSLKLKADWSITGNSAIGNFQHLGLFQAVSYANLSGIIPSRIPNPNLMWETSSQTTIGIRFGLLEDRLKGTVELYNKSTKGILLDAAIPGTSGFHTQVQNLGEIENKGIDIFISGQILKEPFSWTSAFNLAFNKNTVVSLGNGQEPIDLGSNLTMNSVVAGHGLGVFWGAEYAGVNPENGDALFVVNDGNNPTALSPNFDNASFIALGDPNPDLIGGFFNSVKFRSFELSLHLQGVWGNQVHNAAGSYMSCGACWFDNQTRDQLQHWKKPGDISQNPEPRFFWGNGENPRSSRYISEGAYLRVKNLRLTYDLKGKISDLLKLDELKVYVHAYNLLTFTQYKGWDPEVSADSFYGNITSGVDFYAAPQAKTIVGGIHFAF